MEIVCLQPNHLKSKPSASTTAKGGWAVIGPLHPEADLMKKMYWYQDFSSHFPFFRASEYMEEVVFDSP
jgi:hypothetical protein